MTRTMPADFDRFELPDLLVTLCEVGQTSLAARIARSLFPCASAGDSGSAASDDTSGNVASNDTGAAVELRDDRERAGEDLRVPRDEPKAPRTIQSLQRNLKPARRRR